MPQASTKTPKPLPVQGFKGKGAFSTVSRLHEYYTVNGRLYYITDVCIADDSYVVENCETGFSMQVTGTYLKEVTWVARGQCS